MSNTLPQKTYHLYHHQPDPLSPDEVNEQAWVRNNGVTYSVVATITAHTPEEAYQAHQAKMAGQERRSRFVTLREGNVLRATLPGDVLLGEEAAWMVVSQTQLRPIIYEKHQPDQCYTHDATVCCVRWSPDGRHVAAISRSVSLHTPSSTEIRYAHTSYRHHGQYAGNAVEWSADGSRIASGGYSGDVHLWTPNPSGGFGGAATGSIVICRTHEQDSKPTCVTALAWRRDGSSLLAGKTDGDIVWWDARTGDVLEVVKRHQGKVNALVSSPDGTHFASASDDATVRIWQLREQDPGMDVVCQHAGAASSVAWSPDSSLLVSACTNDDQSLQFWDPATGEPAERIPLSISSTRLLTIPAVAWSPDGRYIAAGCDDGTLQVVDVLQRRQVHTYRSEAPSTISSVAWSPDGTLLAAGGSARWSNQGMVQIWQWEPDMGQNRKEQDNARVTPKS